MMGKNARPMKRGIMGRKRNFSSFCPFNIWIFQYSIIPLFLFLLQAEMGEAADQLLYFEAQGIAGYSSELKRAIFYSMNPDAEMQKPSVGFDYIKRFSGESGDWATFALQGRLALTVDAENGNNVKLEPQIYNAYFKLKTPEPYVWVGHNRPAFGLSSYFDSHGLILRTLAIQGFGYDRDWGVGMYKDFSWGDISASATTGSGMPVRFKESYMTAARVSYGVLSRDNMNVGFSLGCGNTLDTMGYKLRDSEPRQMTLAGLDFTFLRNNFEHRFDFLAGKWLGENTYALFYRFGVNLDQEGRWKIEAQPTYWKFGEERNYELSFCISFLATSNLTIRMAYTYDHTANDNRVVMQFYYYRPVQWLSTLSEKLKNPAQPEQKGP
jgi:hypothetical protein